MHVCNVKDLIEDYKRLEKDRDELSHALRQFGHNTQSDTNLQDAKLDTRRPVKLLVAEYERTVDLILAVDSTDLTLDPSGQHGNIPEAALPFFYPEVQ